MTKFCGDIKGFSLIEFCIVIAIVAVLATIGTPWLLSMKVKSSIRADARNVHSALRQAQTEAVKRYWDVCASFDNATGTYEIYDYFGTLSERQLSPGNSFVLATADYFAGDPCFNFRGLPDPPLGGEKSLEITNNRNLLTMEVRMTPGGHVKSEAIAWK